MTPRQRRLLEALNVARGLALSQNMDYWATADNYTDLLKTNEMVIEAAFTSLYVLGFVNHTIRLVDDEPVDHYQITMAGRAALHESRNR